MRWGNVFITRICRGADGAVESLEGEFNPQGSFKDTKKRVTWVSNTVRHAL
jgi:hypothetical protein